MEKLRKSLYLLLAMLIAGCSSALGGSQITPTIDLNAIRTMAAATALYGLTQAAAQFTPTPLPTATETPAPAIQPTPMPEVTLEPHEAVANNNVTVRSRPSSGGDNLGGVLFNQKVNVFARSMLGTWYYISWPDSPTGYAWVIKKAIDLQNADITNLPVIDFDQNWQIIILHPFLWEVAGTPLPIPPVPSGNDIRPATVNTLAYLRVCPNSACLSIGTLNYGQAVNITGRYGDNDWAQIDFPSGPGGKIWIISSALNTGPDGMSGLPYFNPLATPITPEPPTPTYDPNSTPVPTNTPQPAPVGALAIVDGETIIYAEPSTLSAQVGLLKPKEKTSITGISLNGLYYQIQYPPLSEGRAYVSQKYIRPQGDMRYLPYFDDKGNPIPTP